MVDRYHLAMFGLAVGLVIVLSASVGTTAGEPDPDDLLEKAVDSLENDSLEAVQTQRISRPDGEVTQTVIVHQRSSQGGYLEVLDSTGETVGHQIVYNGSTVVQQSPGNDTAVRYEQPSDYVFDEFKTIGASPAEVIDHYQGEYKGTTEVDGRESYVVELSPPEETAAGLSLDIHAGSLEYELPLHEATQQQWYLSQETWWIDKETFYPIKQSVEWTDDDGNIIATAMREYKALAIDSEADTDQFERVFSSNTTKPSQVETELEPALSELERKASPGTVETDSTLIKSDIFETHDDANAAVPFDLPKVDVPARYTYDEAIVHSLGERYSVMLLYTDRETGAKLSVRIDENDSSPFQYNTVIHREHISTIEGDIVVTDSGTEVVRECNDLTYRVRGPPEADTLIQVMESIEC